MKSKSKSIYVCQECGSSSPRWLGRCNGCGAWNSLVEEKPIAEAKGSAGSLAQIRESFGNAQPGGDSKGWVPLSEASQLNELDSEVSPRLNTGIEELNRVLGGGLVQDSFTLLGGDPGIGKSTLLLQMASGVIEQNKDLKMLYVSGEESTAQIHQRAVRLGVSNSDRIVLASETQIERAFNIVRELKPQVMVVDSIQTFVTENIESAPGSVSQVREVAAKLMTLAKSAGVAVWIVGHVTKEGNIAGPKVVEHMVDTVLYFEGDSGQNYRLLRAIKNRFGSARELGVFEMAAEGLREVANPSSLFLSDREHAVSGTAVSGCLEGTRPILVELQALANDSPLAVPRRTSVGIENSRIALIAAILERHVGMSLAQQDLYFNVAGGLRISEPASDLAAAAAIWSTLSDRPISPRAVLIGELGLTGEVRRVSQPEIRVDEAKKLGFEKVLVPEVAIKRCREVDGIEVIGISQIHELAEKIELLN